MRAEVVRRSQRERRAEHAQHAIVHGAGQQQERRCAHVAEPDQQAAQIRGAHEPVRTPEWPREHARRARDDGEHDAEEEPKHDERGQEVRIRVPVGHLARESRVDYEESDNQAWPNLKASHVLGNAAETL